MLPWLHSFGSDIRSDFGKAVNVDGLVDPVTDVPPLVWVLNERNTNNTNNLTDTVIAKLTTTVVNSGSTSRKQVVVNLHLHVIDGRLTEVFQYFPQSLQHRANDCQSTESSVSQLQIRKYDSTRNLVVCIRPQVLIHITLPVLFCRTPGKESF